MRLIDADALTKAHCDGCAKDIQEMCKTAPVCASMMWVVEAPTVDAVEVVHGRWIDVALRFTQVKEKCSVCGGIVYAHGFNYCPNCGAKMDGDGNE